MVEAAVIFPLVTMAVIFVIYMLINMYAQVATNSILHTAVADEAMRVSGICMQRDIENEDDFGSLHHIWFPDKNVEIERVNSLLGDTLRGNVTDESRVKGLLESVIERKYSIEMEIVDEEEYIRCVDAITGIAKGAV